MMETGYLRGASSYLSSTVEDDTRAITPYNNLKTILTIAIGCFIVLCGLFLLLAALQILPHGINAISQWGIASKIAGAIVIGTGMVVIGFGIYRCPRNQQDKIVPTLNDGSISTHSENPNSSTHLLGTKPKHQIGNNRKRLDVPDSTIDPMQLLSLSSKKKKNIAEGKLSQKSIKDEYERLTKNRNIPPLCGFNQFATENFALLMPGIAVIAALLSRKHNLHNLWVCQNLNVLQNRLQEIQSSPNDQRHAFIVPTHSTMNSRGHKKAENWEQHKLTICVEKINGHMHIYMLETMLAPWNGISQNQINLDESLPFTEQELVLAFIDSAKLKRSSTSVYTASTRREFVGGCSTFALRDALYFLRDDNFTKKLVTEKSKNTLPKTGIILQTISALPPECMQLTQSLSTIEKYQQHYPDLAQQPFGVDSKKTLSKNVVKTIVVNTAENRRENHRIARNILKYQCVILELLNHATDNEIQSLIGQTLI